MPRRGFQGAVLRSMGARDHDLVVTGTEQIAPHLRRIWLRSETLFDELDPGPTSWVRLWVPDPEGSAAEFQRGYTLSVVDEDSGDFAIDFVLHEPPGPASAWATAAEPGHRIQAMVLGTTKFSVPDEPPAGYLLIGDSASIPAINGIIRVVPPSVPVELYLERHHEHDALIPLVEHPRLRAHWVPRKDSAALAASLESRDWSDWYAWATPESASLKHLRGRLRDELGFPKSEIHAQAYWVEGRAMGTKREQEEAAPPVASPASSPEPSREDAVAHQAPHEERPALSGVAPKGAWRADASRRLLGPMRRTFWGAGLLQGAITVLQLVPYVLLVELARQLLDGAPPETLAGLGVLALIVMGAGVALESGLMWWLHRVDAGFERDVRERLLAKLARLPLGWFTSRGSGRVKKLVQDDPLSLHYLLTHAIPDAVAAVVAPVVVLAYLLVVDWRLALLMFVPVLVYLVTMYLMVAASGARIRQNQQWIETMNAEATAYLEAQPVVRIFGGAATSAFRRRLGEYLRFLNEWQRPFIGRKSVMDLAARPTTFLWLLAAAGTIFVVDQSLDPVDLLPFLVLGTTFGARLLGIGYGVAGIREGVIAARDIQIVLEEAELTRKKTPAVEAAAALEFEGVGFAYRRGVPVLQDISLELRPGTVTALVGPSGSGKSTLASLAARFHDASEGAVRVGGRDVRSLTDEELYARVGFVFQEIQLVHGTVAENIALARPEATRAEVEEAARQAQIHERVLRLPRGYHTVLGDDAGLSGGERQRLAIARALLADTEVLVLDEATAFADPESEYQVQQALTRLTADRTVLVIAHRLHTITHADRIVVLEDGRIVETGSHEELLRGEGRYRDLWVAGGNTR